MSFFMSSFWLVVFRPSSVRPTGGCLPESKPYVVAWECGRSGQLFTEDSLKARETATLREFESLILRPPATECRSRIGLESDREPMNIYLLAFLIGMKRWR